MAEQQLSAPVRAEDGVPPSPRAGVVHIRYRHTERFTVVGNHLAQHEDLSLTAIGLAVPAEPAPAPGLGAYEGESEAAELLASLRGEDPRLLLSQRDIARLAPAAAAWLERGVTPEAAARTLSADLPREPIRSPYAVLSHRLTHWLPPSLPAPRRAPEAPRPHPFQTCESCDLAFRGPEPGECRDCSSEHDEPTIAA